jgi:alkylation response protein AidB-like acyl-CoA dehydrogenase
VDCTVSARQTALGPVHTIAVGELGEPLRANETVLAADHLRRAAWFTGLGAACLTAAVRRAGHRTQFGTPILDNQSIGFGLAELATWCRALRALTREQAGSPDPAIVAGLLAEAAEFATEAAGYAVHVHGAFGLLAGSPVAAHYRAVPLAAARCPRLSTLRRSSATGDPSWKGSPA